MRFWRGGGMGSLIGRWMIEVVLIILNPLRSFPSPYISKHDSWVLLRPENEETNEETT
jgi:hypothetical protein